MLRFLFTLCFILSFSSSDLFSQTEPTKQFLQEQQLIFDIVEYDFETIIRFDRNDDESKIEKSNRLIELLNLNTTIELTRNDTGEITHFKASSNSGGGCSSENFGSAVLIVKENEPIIFSIKDKAK